MRIGIIGLGYVGLTLSVVAVASGKEVYGVELKQIISNQSKANIFMGRGI